MTSATDRIIGGASLFGLGSLSSPIAIECKRLPCVRCSGVVLHRIITPMFSDDCDWKGDDDDEDIDHRDIDFTLIRGKPHEATVREGVRRP